MTRITTAQEALAAVERAGLAINEHLPVRLLLDIRGGVISPATSLRSLRRQYGEADKTVLVESMREACRWDAALCGSVAIVSDGASGEIIEQLPLPYTADGYGGRCPEGLGLSAMTWMLDRNVEYFEAREFFLHVHIMPRAHYRRMQGRHVALLGELLLTYRGWDKKAEDLEVPFPTDLPLLDRQVCYQYSPRRGYIGFDGERWRSEW